ncbi:hypothetical protein CRE_28683 [Caenorhabditis remanei]|uniref:SPK domain-containing protein n=1 Tax=Caenorhabditis remanei TaxID=31234 RepID=E3MJZ8_CAERE|nr:hypothetical protein CRE_28683 [Caenorhabditis remanei]
MTEARQPKWLGLGEENVKIMNFLARKTEKIESPLHLNQLSCDLRDHVGSPSPADTFKKRIRSNKSKIEEDMAYSDETKVKMIFGLGASISDKYLEELVVRFQFQLRTIIFRIRKDAIVRVDERRRIIRYQRKDGEFELRGVHRYHDALTRFERTEKMLEFLAEKAETATSPQCHSILAREFKERIDSPDNEIIWENRFHQVIGTIYRARYMRQTRIKMMFMTSCKLTEEQLKRYSDKIEKVNETLSYFRYRDRAEIEVDSKNRIIKYKANDGSCELKGDHSMGVKMLQGKEEVKRRSKLMSKDSSDDEEESDGETTDDDETIRLVNQMTASVKKEKETPKARRLPNHKDRKVDKTQKKVSGDSESEEKEGGSDSEVSSDSDEENEAEKDENSDSDEDDEEETEKSVNQKKPLKTKKTERTPLPKTSEVSKPTESNSAAEAVGGSREEILKSFSRGDTAKSNEKSVEAIIANRVNQRIENRVKEITEQSKARGTVVGGNSQKKRDSNGMTVKTVGEAEKENVAAREVPSENSNKNQKTASMLKENSQNPVVAPNSGNNESNSQESDGHADNGKELPSVVQSTAQQITTTSKDKSETSKASVSETTETETISEISAGKRTEPASGESRDLVTPKIPRGDLKRKIGEEDDVDPVNSLREKNKEGEEEPSKRTKMEKSGDIQFLQSTLPETSSEGIQFSSNESSGYPASDINSLQILEWMKAFTRTLCSTTLIEFITEIDRAIRELAHHNISSADLIPFLESGLLLIKSGSKSTSSQEESMDLKDFLKNLRNSFFYLNSPGFDEFQKKIERIIGGISGEDKIRELFNFQMTDEIQWSEEEEDVLYDFLVEKCQNTRIRFDIDQLCKEFRRANETNKTPESVRTKIIVFRREIPMSDEYETETKIRMMFGLKARIGTELLEELRKDAIVKLNGNKRIVFYQEKIQGGLKLDAYENENDPATIFRTDSQMLRLIERLSNSMGNTISGDLFIAKYRESTGSKESWFFLTERYRIVRSRIFESSEFDLEKKVRLMYFTNTRIEENVLAELRKEAFVVLYDNGYIKSYVARDGSFELIYKTLNQRNFKRNSQDDDLDYEPEEVRSLKQEKRESLPRSKRFVASYNEDSDGSENADWSEEENVDLTQFCLEKCQNVQLPLDVLEVAREFKEFTESDRYVSYIKSRIDELKINELTNLDVETRVKMMFALKIKIGDDLLQELCANADVKLNTSRHIKKYTSHDGRLKLTNNRKAWTEKEEKDLLKYLVDNCHRVKLQYDMWNFCEDYKQSSGTHRTVNFLNYRIKQLRPKIYDSTELDLETKAQLLFGLGVIVREDLLVEYICFRFRKNAKVEVNGFKRMIMYRSNDGKLKLPRVDDVIQESDEDVLQNEDSIGRVTRRSVNQKRIVVKKEIKVETGHIPMSVEPDTDQFPMIHGTTTAPISIEEEVYYSQNPATTSISMESNIVSNASENRGEGGARETVLKSFSRDVSERSPGINSDENSVADHTEVSPYPDLSIYSIPQEIMVDDFSDSILSVTALYEQCFREDEESNDDDDEKRRRRESADKKIAKNLEEIRMKSVLRREESVESDEEIDVETIGNSDSSDENPIEEEETPNSSNSTAGNEASPIRESMKSGNSVVQSVTRESVVQTTSKEGTPDSSSIAGMVIPNRNLVPPIRKSMKNTRSVSVPPRYFIDQSGGSRAEILKSFSRGDTTKSNEKSAEAIIANIVNQRIENRVKEITEQSKARGTVVGDNSRKTKDSNGMTVKTVGEAEKENVAAKEVPSENSIKNQKTASMLKENSQNAVVASGNNESNSQGSACHADNGKEQQNPTTSKNQSETSKASVSVTTETDAISEISAEKSTESAPRESRDLMTPKIPRGDLKRKIGEEDEVDPSKRAKRGVDSGETPKENQNTMIPTSDDSSGNQICCDSMKTSISLRSVFIWMKEFVQCLYSKEFEGFLMTLEKEMNGFTDQNILISDITPFIDTFLVFAKKGTTSTTQSLNVKDFLTKLKITLYMMSSVIFADFQEKIDKMIAEIDRENMVI